ncbi:cytochrome bc1 complex cytochrome b subunit [Amycolatopsis keratiniphila]|uniref:cytochrome bc1 complex cytochrome b subunit n=1 Tax=Amycolatopsis keratiniphila TaxID=129921 RepID=UPI00087D7003|nr:cytochrome bc complex cytochrome b subunit [Amycolatopsis keratiniphila]SDU44057.1 menaquinol-cytochrome c reductase cytochrome b subunit precursor [Amycolatopsis keratiniphila]
MSWVSSAFEWWDHRFHAAGGVRKQLNKVFPTHWSFLLGEIALYSLVVLLLSGTYLALFFDPSMEQVRYEGSYTLLHGVRMSRAFESSLDLSFDVRGGLMARQVHHWAALVFVAAILVHMLRVFFTGAFRRPREMNWVVGMLLFTLALAEGFAGYSLPDDLLSGTGLRIASGITLSIPLIGTWAHWALFGGEFAGTEIIPRLYGVHVFLLPGLILALVAVHLGLVWYQKHTQFPGAGRSEDNVVGVRIVPVFAVKSGALFAGVAGTLGAMGGLLQINPIWNYGPYHPAHVSTGSQPDWYLIWVDGAARIWPAWEIPVFGHRVPAPLWPTVILPALTIGLALVYPWLDRKLTADHAPHNIAQRPRDVPVRTGLGTMALTFLVVLYVSGINDILAHTFQVSLDAAIWAGRLGIVFLPPLAFFLTYRWCIGAQRSDRRVLEHGIETGIITRSPHGAFLELHQPLASGDDEQRLDYAGAPVPKKPNALGLAGSPAPGGLFRPDPRPETQALDEARKEAHDEH